MYVPRTSTVLYLSTTYTQSASENSVLLIQYRTGTVHSVLLIQYCSFSTAHSVLLIQYYTVPVQLYCSFSTAHSVLLIQYYYYIDLVLYSLAFLDFDEYS